MPNQSLTKRQSPEELELDANRLKLAGLLEALAFYCHPRAGGEPDKELNGKSSFY